METNEIIRLAVALLLIGAAIYYIESTKPMPAAPPINGQIAPDIGNMFGSPQGRAAPELRGITGYINAPDNLTIASLRGKVVLVDFWTYSCINCIRTIPYLESYYQKYSQDGFVIVGVHTPEFDFEKNYANVQSAVQKYGITYPVVLDSNRATWDAYANQYWPRHYLIDAQGRVRFDHIGEGGYDETEAQIVQLLSEAKNSTVQMNTTEANATQADFGRIGTPEIYFGNSFRRAPLGNADPKFEGDTINATIPPGSLTPNIAYVEGSWQNGADVLNLTGSSGAIELAYTAKSVNIVAGSLGNSTVLVSVDGASVPCADSGKETCTISGQRLYTVADMPDYGTHTLRLDIRGAGFEIFTFTFG